MSKCKIAPSVATLISSGMMDRATTAQLRALMQVARAAEWDHDDSGCGCPRGDGIPEGMGKGPYRCPVCRALSRLRKASGTGRGKA